jgi:hypothetical protein
MQDWVLEGLGNYGEVSTVFRADEGTMHAIVDFKSRCGLHVLLREARSGETSAFGGELPIIVISADCTDWVVLAEFHGNSWPRVYRNTSLNQIINLAYVDRDGVCTVDFHPASPDEIAKHVKQQGSDKVRKADDIQVKVRSQIVATKHDLSTLYRKLDAEEGALDTPRARSDSRMEGQNTVDRMICDLALANWEEGKGTSQFRWVVCENAVRYLDNPRLHDPTVDDSFCRAPHRLGSVRFPGI